MDTKQEDKRKIIATTLAAPLAGMIAKFVMHPIDTIKCKVQVNRMQMKTLKTIKAGIVKSITLKTFEEEGIRGFFRGVTISVLGSAVAFSFYMSAYERSKARLLEFENLKHLSWLCHLAAGFCAQIVSCSLWLPIDIIKERLQVQSNVKIYNYKGPIEAIKKIKLSEGIIGLYRAFGATLLFFGPFSAIFFCTFEKLKELIVAVPGSPSLLESIIASAGAGAVAGYLTTPLQLVKLRMQIQRADVAVTKGKLQNSIFGYKNALHGLYLILKNEGIYALYKGAMLRICFSVPMTTLSMTLTEQFRKRLLKNNGFMEYFI